MHIIMSRGHRSRARQSVAMEALGHAPDQPRRAAHVVTVMAMLFTATSVAGRSAALHPAHAGRVDEFEVTVRNSAADDVPARLRQTTHASEQPNAAHVAKGGEGLSKKGGVPPLRIALDPTGAWEAVYRDGAPAATTASGGSSRSMTSSTAANRRDGHSASGRERVTACPNPVRAGADSMPVAWVSRRADGPPLVSFISASSHGIYPLTGSSLDNLNIDCRRVVFNSTLDTDPDTFANYQWLQSVRVLANGSGYGLVHNEFKGEFSPPGTWCTCTAIGNASCVNHCELWSTGLAVSHDDGLTFSLEAAPPQHLVAALPARFEFNQPLAGYGAISPLMPGGDGYYYAIINVNGDSLASGVAPGNCIVRSNNLGDPKSFRGRDASGAYTVQWQSPYSNASVGGWGACATIPTNASTPLAPHVCWREIVPKGCSDPTICDKNDEQWPTFVALGDVGGPQFEPDGAVRYTWSHAAKFADAVDSWSAQQVLPLTGASRWMGMGKTEVLYPVLLDSSSPVLGEALGTPEALEQGDNFALVGANSSGLHVYIVTSGRVIIRHRVVLTRSPPSPPPPPPPSPPANCLSFRVFGAGDPAANGIYNATNTSNAVPSAMYRKDDDHQIYRVWYSSKTRGDPSGYQWHLGHFDVAGSVVYATQPTHALLNQSLPPSDGWRCASSMVAPSPLLLCLDDI